MELPRGGVYIVLGEMSSLLTAMRRNNHQDEGHEMLIRSFTELKDVLNQVGDLQELDPNHFLGPFLEVIRSEETTSPVTSLALSAINKFLSFSLIDKNTGYLPTTVNSIANAVTHAKFVGTDASNDAVVLMRILQVLRTLVLSSSGLLLTNRNVCDIMLSCFRICFEMRLSELLRRFAENCLKDMVQLLFMRLPTFSEDPRSFNLAKLKMRRGKQKPFGKHKNKKKERIESIPGLSQTTVSISNAEDAKSPNTVLDMQGAILNSPPVEMPNKPFSEANEIPSMQLNETVKAEEDTKDEQVKTTCENVVISIENSYHESATPTADHENKVIVIETSQKFRDDGVVNEKEVTLKVEEIEATPVKEEKDASKEATANADVNKSETEPHQEQMEEAEEKQERVNQQGVRFTASPTEVQDGRDEPYGLVCVVELLRLLASLVNPLDKQNSEAMIQTGLALITVALEVGADAISRFPSLLDLVKDDLSRSLFSLLSCEKVPIFAANVQVCFLLFESLRTHLKFQFQLFLSKLTDLIVNESSKVPYEMKELSLETVVQLWRIPGLVTELYLNFDCDLFCPNLYEELANLLSKNAFPLGGVDNTHLLSLDALLTVIDSIESNCHSRILSEKQHNNSENSVDAKKEEPTTIPLQNFSSRIGSRHKISVDIPSHEQIMAIKRKKKLLATGTEHFNSKPKKGIAFLQEQGLLSATLDPEEVASFLRENPHLDKKMIGEFISNRSNLAILNSFLKSFDFTDTRIDESLRLYLESFRLPGEAPLISLVMEHFADHWHKCNNEPFANADAAFTLAYAVIMLNVDQHNHNVKKQNHPMTCEDFKKNLKKVNGGENFDERLLDDIYESIKNAEIVMPAEQTGIVKENYIWKTMLRRGATKDGIYTHAPAGLFDHSLFSIIWSPTVTALSALYDKTNDAAIYQKAISGFRKCAMISAHYGMCNDFDQLIISLCKFTNLLNSMEVNMEPEESPETVTVAFGSNPKAKLAAKAVFNLAHRHGDIIRDSWRNILECLLQLYKCKLLPKILVEAEDFIELSGKISLMREDMMTQMNQKPESGLLSSLYSYISLGAENNSSKGPSAEDQEAIKLAQNCIRECRLEQLVTESKFLRFDSLQHFIKALIRASYGPEGHISLGSSYSEGTAVFFLELLLKVIITNRERIGTLWPKIKEHLYTLMMGAAACNHRFLVERCVVGLLRLAIRLMRKEEMGPTVLQSLRMLLLLKSLSQVARHVAYGMLELLKTSAANIHSATDWAIIFTLLECVGAGAPPPRVVTKPPLNHSGAKSEGECTSQEGAGTQSPDRGYTSDSELSRVGGSGASSPDLPQPAGWILVGKDGEIQLVTGAGGRVPPPDHDRELGPHDPFALVKCVDALSFLVRDVAHITPYNFENCVHCIRTFVQATVTSNEKKPAKKPKESVRSKRKFRSRKEESTTAYDADESDPEDMPNGYSQVCIQLMDLMHTLHTRTAQIYRWWAEEDGGVAEHMSLWQDGWCPLLEGIASLCSHPDKVVRMSAITYLQRALLVSDLAVLTGSEWESCFTRVLFPLLSRILEPGFDAADETRIRAATVLSKVFLHHLSPLQSLPSFLKLWMTILDYMDKYMHADNSDLLLEAVPESLKNMLLVMDSAEMFSNEDGTRNELWALTWDRISSFPLNLQVDLFRPNNPEDTAPAENSTTAEELKIDTTQHQESQITETPTIDIPSSPIPQSSPVQRAPAEVSVPSVQETHGIVTASLVTSTPENWQPPAPIFPHIGQILSTPIGPCISSNSSSTINFNDPASSACLSSFSNISDGVTSEPPNPSLPVYSGFATNAPPKPGTLPPSAQFFYQDLPQMPTTNLASQPTTTKPGAPMLLNPEVINPSQSPGVPQMAVVISPEAASL